MRVHRVTPIGVDQTGQALAEFAMVLPMLLLLILALFEFARAWNTMQVMTDAAREAARRGVIASTPPPDSGSVISTVHAAMARASLDTGKATVEISVEGGAWPGVRGKSLTVGVSYPYEFHYVGRLLSWAAGQESITLRTSAVMRKE